MNTHKKGFLDENFHFIYIYIYILQNMNPWLQSGSKVGLPPKIRGWFPNVDLASTLDWKLPIIGIFMGRGSMCEVEFLV